MNRTKATTKAATTKSVKKRFKIALQKFSILAYIAAITTERIYFDWVFVMRYFVTFLMYTVKMKCKS